MAEGTRLQELRRELTQMVAGLISESEKRRQDFVKDSMEEIRKMIGGLSLQQTEVMSQSVAQKDEGSSLKMNSEARMSWEKVTRLEFPRFNGDNFDTWITKVEYYFDVDKTLSEDRVKVAALHLEDRAIQWHQGFMKTRNNSMVTWEEYVTAMRARFGNYVYDDPLADLRNLRQVSSLQQYLDEFGELYPRAGIREDQALSFFLSGLINALQMPVRMFRPKTLSDAYALAKLQEITVAAIKDQPKPVTRTPYVPSVPKVPIYHKNNTACPPKISNNSGLLPTPNIPRLPYGFVSASVSALVEDSVGQDELETNAEHVSIQEREYVVHNCDDSLRRRNMRVRSVKVKVKKKKKKKSVNVGIVNIVQNQGVRFAVKGWRDFLYSECPIGFEEFSVVNEVKAQQLTERDLNTIASQGVYYCFHQIFRIKLGATTLAHKRKRISDTHTKQWEQPQSFQSESFTLDEVIFAAFELPPYGTSHVIKKFEGKAGYSGLWKGFNVAEIGITILVALELSNGVNASLEETHKNSPTLLQIQMVEMYETILGRQFNKCHELGQYVCGEELGLFIVVPQQVVYVGFYIVYVVNVLLCYHSVFMGCQIFGNYVEDNILISLEKLVW